MPELETVIAPTEIDAAEIIPQTAAAANQNRSYVRVSYDRLSDLINLVREMVVSRSVFQQRLAEFGTQIEELRNSTRRLNGSTSRLETEFEAEMLGGGTPSVNFSQVALNEAFYPQLSNSNAFDSLEFDRYTEFHQITRELIETSVDNFTLTRNLTGCAANLKRFSIIKTVSSKKCATLFSGSEWSVLIRSPSICNAPLNLLPNRKKNLSNSKSRAEIWRMKRRFSMHLSNLCFILNQTPSRTASNRPERGV